VNVQVRVLGTTELAAGHGSQPIGSERQRRLLAALAMHAPGIVATDGLISAVWADTHPENGASALRTVVTRLRRTFDGVEPGSGEHVLTRPPGYALDLPGTCIDANEFADLVADGRRALAEGEVATALDQLHRALAMWSGPAYAEFRDEPWAHAEALRLERTWVTAREAELEARLDLGLHREAVGDIERLVADEPLSDGPRGLLMRAEFACGRQADALRQFQAYRETLAEVGLEPGQALNELEGRIAVGDPALLPDAGRPLRGYRLHERLWATEQGEVFRGTQPGLGRDVAVEVIPAEVANEASFVRTFRARSQAIAQLGHAHVVPLFDGWRDPSGAYVVSQLLTGGTLADQEVVDRLGTDGLERVRSQVRSALDVAHQAGLVHGDIDASDVQLDEHDNAYLANFRYGSDHPSVAEDDRSFTELFSRLLGARPLAPATAPARLGNPYRGLAAFDQADVDVFHGRNRLVGEVLHSIEHRRCAFVVGPSGSGKSSVVRAGVLPALAAGEVAGADRWFAITMTPGARPFEELEAAVLQVAVHPPTTLLDQLRDPAQPLGRTIQRILPDPTATTVLVIDQLEELYTLAEEEERRAFLHAVAAAVRPRDGALRLVTTLRADYYDAPLGDPAIAALCKRTTVAVDALTGDELSAAIVEPARLVGVTVDSDLVARMIADASVEASVLPLVQYTLTRLFDTRSDDVLTLEGYARLGGIAGSIGARAEELYGELDAEGREVCRRTFGRLVAIGGAATDTRRRVRMSELQGAEADQDRVDGVIAAFVDARLLATDRDPATREPTVEVAHEALFREWPRLRGWITDDRQTIASIRHLATATESWRQTGHESELYRGARLVGALELADQHADRLTTDEQSFIAASRDRADAEARAQRRQNTRLRTLLGATAVLLVLALVAGALAVTQASRADDRAAAAEDATAAGDIERLSNLASSAGAVPQDIAILAGLEAYRLDPSPETLTALHWALTSKPGYRGVMGDTVIGGDITLLDDGDRIVTHTVDTIEVWDVPSRERLRSWPIPGAEDATNHRTLRSTASGDGRLLVVSAPSVTTVLDAESGERRATISHPSRALANALAPDGQQLAVALEDGTVQIHDLTAPGQLTAEFPSVDAGGNIDAVTRLAWHPNGTQIALGSERGSVALWDLGRNEPTWRHEGCTAYANLDPAPALLFDTAGDRLVVTGIFGDRCQGGSLTDPVSVEVLESITGEPVDGGAIGSAAPTTTTTVRSLTWLDEEENVVLTSGQGGFLHAVDLATGVTSTPGEIGNFEASAALPEHGLIVSEAALGLDVHAVDGSDPLVRRVASPREWQGTSTFPALDAAGDRLLISSFRQGAAELDLTEPRAEWDRSLMIDGQSVCLALSELRAPGVLGVSTAERCSDTPWRFRYRDWDFEPIEPAQTSSDDTAAGFAGGMSTDRTRRYSSGGGGPIGGGLVVKDVASGEALFDLDPQEGPFICCPLPHFSLDGELFAVPQWAGGTRLHDANTGEEVPFDRSVNAKLFGPRGTWYVSVDERGTLHKRDQQSGESIGQPMPGHRGAVQWVAHNPATRRLATTGFDNTARVWDLSATAAIGRPMDTSSIWGWPSWSEDGRYLAVPTRDGVEIWNFDTDDWPRMACEVAGRNLTEAEWEQFGPRTIERRATCEQFPL
jgi:DNA-binding SARP family transcriptional activator/WD40 repeat protein